jgi:hypothetical protein
MCPFVDQRRFLIDWKCVFLKLFIGRLVPLVYRFSYEFCRNKIAREEQLRGLSDFRNGLLNQARTATL